MANALSLGATIESLKRPLGNHVSSKIGGQPTQSVRDIPADVAWYAYTCSHCGYCVLECDQFYGRGWESQSPRGKWYFGVKQVHNLKEAMAKKGVELARECMIFECVSRNRPSKFSITT